MKTVTFMLHSRTPLLMNRFAFGKKADQISVSDSDALKDVARTRAIAEEATYRNAKGQLVIPTDNLYRALITAGSKVKKGKSNFSTTVASALILSDDLALLDENNKPITDFVTDIRRGKNPSTKGSVPIIRARINDWRGKLTISYDETLIKETDLLQIVEALGRTVGLLDFRPEKKGSYGHFVVDTTSKI